MKPDILAKSLSVSSNTVRKWVSTFEQYLSPSATPPKGKTRVFTEHDIRILLLVHELRNAGMDYDSIGARLESEQANDWLGLPNIPDIWKLSVGDGGRIPVEVAAARAGEMAQLAVLRSELEHTHAQLEVANRRVLDLENELEELQKRLVGVSQENVQLEKNLQEQAIKLEQHRHQVEIELLQARADVARLEGQLSSYSLGRAKPLNVGLLLIGAAVFGVFLVLVVFVVANLLP